ncbi:hypothetical protein EYR41_004241 [Orbilia oligospora]|uniref:Uncharacterized protein n=1 Tax=Orbilia oligospora TaxID=2813651 RepID=A0A7C8JUM3_ORBOL|nr:hypothetical protein TWF751_005053 [Orbilia oligospora]TGJ72342.1 hypothetical protein EYR41_004241 [Orbilia oligospora]
MSGSSNEILQEDQRNNPTYFKCMGQGALSQQCPAIRNRAIAASPPTAPPTIAPRGGPDVLEDVGITVSKVTEVPEVIEASEGKDVCTSVELSDKLEDDATVISDEKATEDEAAAVGVTIVVGGLDIDVTRVL